jgi:translation elongation factor EF-G
MQEMAEHYREALIEAVAETDEELLNAYVSTGSRRRRRSGVACASAHSTPRSSPSCAGLGCGTRDPTTAGRGDRVSSRSLTYPRDWHQSQDRRRGDPPSDPEAPFAALAFKISLDQGRKLTYFGSIRVGPLPARSCTMSIATSRNASLACSGCMPTSVSASMRR